MKVAGEIIEKRALEGRRAIKVVGESRDDIPRKVKLEAAGLRRKEGAWLTGGKRGVLSTHRQRGHAISSVFFSLLFLWM